MAKSWSAKSLAGTFVAVVVLGAAMTSLPVATAQEKADRDHPNIVFINADDLGWTDLGFMGSSFYETPHLDRLATEGMIFTHAYAAAANCAPSRASVFSGQYGPRHGIYTVGASARGEDRFRKLIPTPNTLYLSADQATFVAELRQAGYATCHVGKWHLGNDPRDHGFETNIGGWSGGSPAGGYFSPYKNPALPSGPKGEHLTDRLTDEAIGYLRNRDDERPFFLSMQFYIPHSPLQAKPETVAKYEARIPTTVHFNPVYAAMIEHLDTAVGRLLGSLDELGLRENTVVLFTSDNGGVHRFSHQSPLRGEKGSYYEGGIRVPMIVRWPGQVAGGSRSAIPVSGIDFFPTFLKIAGVLLPDDRTLDGVSLVPLLKGDATLPERPHFWHFPIYLQAIGEGNVETRDPWFRTRPGTVVRLGRWKLHEYFEDEGLELYDLENDPGERRDLSAILPERAQELHLVMKAWRKETGAPVPVERNPVYDPAAEAEAIQAFYRR